MKHIYSIGGGKGGSGKSFIAASLGVLLANQGKKVVLVDLDLGASNLHTLLGQKIPQFGLDGFIDKKTDKLEDVALSTTVSNLYLISSVKCSLEIANLYHAQKIKLIKAIKRLPFDYILLDLGPGTSFNTLDFFLIAQEGLFVATPEPTAIENTFIFIKSVYLRKLRQALNEARMWHIYRDEVARLAKSTLKSPLELINILVQKESEKGKILEDVIGSLRFRLILNKFRNHVNHNLGEQLVDVCNRHLYPNFYLLGNISYDSGVYESIVARSIFIKKYPYTRTASDLQNVAECLMEEGQQPSQLRVSR